MSGYRDSYLVSKWNDRTSGACTLMDCNFFPGDATHYLSGECPALSRQLNLTLSHSLQILSASHQFLVPPVISALGGSAEDWTAFILDPHTDPLVIKIRQLYGSESVWPLFRLSRAYVWCMDRERKKLME